MSGFLTVLKIMFTNNEQSAWSPLIFEFQFLRLPFSNFANPLVNNILKTSCSHADPQGWSREIKISEQKRHNYLKFYFSNVCSTHSFIYYITSASVQVEVYLFRLGNLYKFSFYSHLLVKSKKCKKTLCLLDVDSLAGYN